MATDNLPSSHIPLILTFQLESRQTGKGIHLPWMCRLSIATDTARGLAYLHTADKRNPLVHRDVKR